MEWSWQRIAAEYLVTGVKLARGGKVESRKGFLHVKKGRVEAIGVGSPTVEGLPSLNADGLVLAPASARLLSEIMLQKPASLKHSDYNPM